MTIDVQSDLRSILSDNSLKQIQRVERNGVACFKGANIRNNDVKI